MNKVIYKRNMLLLFVVNLLMFILLPWSPPWSFGLWLLYLCAVIKLHVYTVDEPFIATLNGKTIDGSPSAFRKRSSYFVDMFLFFFLLPIFGGIALFYGFNEPSLIKLLLKQLLS
jgi:hypothetical protein